MFCSIARNRIKLHKLQMRQCFSLVTNYSDNRKQFDKVWPVVKKDMLEAVKKFDGNKRLIDRFDKVLEYNVPHGKKIRGLLSVKSHQVLSDDLSEDNTQLANILGWCIEVLQAGILVHDDIMDASLMRRGQPSWYTFDDIGMKAINDGSMMMSGMYGVLDKHLSNKPYYSNIVKLFQDTSLCTWVGQSLDMDLENQNVLSYTMEQYETVAKNKTTFYSVYLPIAAAMRMTGKDDPDVLERASNIIFEIGKLLQIQDDMLDAFGDPKITGKVGTDIQEHKCTWLAIMCNQLASREQRKTLEECYGFKNLEKITKVKKLFIDLELSKIYEAYEEELCRNILKPIESSANHYELFNYLLGKLRGRKF